MNRFLTFASFSLVSVLGACTFLSAYTITFTTPAGTEVDPASDTLDFVVSTPALAYISTVECDGSEDIELLPVLTDEMRIQAAHNLSLSLLSGQAPGTECEVTVTVFDQTTTSNARATLSLVVRGEDVPEVTPEPAEAATDEPTEVLEPAVLDESVVVEEPTTTEPAAEPVPAEEGISEDL